MNNFRNRWVYAGLAGLLAGPCVLLFYAVFLKAYDLDSLLRWGGCAMILAAGAALLMWPRHHEPSLRRLLIMGFSISVFVTFILGLIFSVLNPGFPDATRDGIETNISHIFSGGVVMFFVFSIMTFGVPYILGIALSVPFAKLDRD